MSPHLPPSSPPGHVALVAPRGCCALTLGSHWGQGPPVRSQGWGGSVSPRVALLHASVEVTLAPCHSRRHVDVPVPLLPAHRGHRAARSGGLPAGPVAKDEGGGHSCHPGVPISVLAVTCIACRASCSPAAGDSGLCHGQGLGATRAPCTPPPLWPYKPLLIPALSCPWDPPIAAASSPGFWGSPCCGGEGSVRQPPPVSPRAVLTVRSQGLCRKRSAQQFLPLPPSMQQGYFQESSVGSFCPAAEHPSPHQLRAPHRAGGELRTPPFSG